MNTLAWLNSKLRNNQMQKHNVKLLEMLKYCRSEGSVGQEEFCLRFLNPVFGQPDKDGNYLCYVGDPENAKPTIAFMAHHDTVHNFKEKRQRLKISGNKIMTTNGSCLGADCTTGVWLMLEMIHAGVEGYYIVHAGEECGGVGASSIVTRCPEWLKGVDVAISFDRYGNESVITHQGMVRTASDEFADSLIEILGLGLQKDDGGTYTDSKEYCEIIPECTNLSVGYMHQHSRREYQDLSYVNKLRAALIDANWSELVVVRDPSVVEYHHYYKRYRNYSSNATKRALEEWDAMYPDVNGRVTSGGALNYGTPVVSKMEDDMAYLIRNYPEEAAVFLHSMGFNYDDLLEEFGLTIDARKA